MHQHFCAIRPGCCEINPFWMPLDPKKGKAPVDNSFDAPVQRTALDSGQAFAQLPQGLVMGTVHYCFAAI